MNKEDKQLLLQDLCARLPYGVICDIYNDISTIKEKLLFGGVAHFADDTICVRPYLRPMSSMTEEELKEFQKFRDISPLDWLTVAHDWLLSKHFDIRGLIPKGLAIAVTKENDPYNVLK